MLLLLCLNNMLLLEALECKRFALVIHVLYQLHSAKSPNTQCSYYIQIVQTDVVIL